MNEIIDIDRIAFEEWMSKTHKRPGTHFTRSTVNGAYMDNRVAAKWAAWKAALRYARLSKLKETEISDQLCLNGQTS